MSAKEQGVCQNCGHSEAHDRDGTRCSAWANDLGPGGGQHCWCRHFVPQAIPGWLVPWEASGLRWEADVPVVTGELCWHLRVDSKLVGVVQPSIFGTHWVSGMIGGPGAIGSVTHCASALVALAKKSGGKKL